MSLLKELIKEMSADGSTGAGAIAAYAGSLFKGGPVDKNRSKNRQKFLFKRQMRLENSQSLPKSSHKWTQVVFELASNMSMNQQLGDPTQNQSKTPADEPFDTADVISKLDAAEKKAQLSSDTVTFGLEDEEGNIIKVYVAAEQSDEFEDALGSMLATADTDENNVTSSQEIAEVLFQLKDKFQIVNVEWPTIEGDEDEEQLNINPEEDPEAAGLEGGDMDMEADATAPDDTEAATSALQQVIDVLKADAEAKKEEAKAKAAEAEAKQAEYAAQAASAKVKQEEDILDMETFYKEKKDKDKEAKTIAKLAKYKHELASGAESSLATEDEETTVDKDENSISVDDLASMILQHLRHN